jgi:hypothetical protein
MSIKKKRFIFSIIVTLSTFLLVTTTTFPRILQNGSGQGYTDGSGTSEEKAATQAVSIEMYVVQGGGYFLKAHAAVQELLNRVEWQDIKAINYDELNRLAGSALYNMTLARSYYWQLLSLAEVTPYNPVVIEKLKGFDYDAFMKENGLNPAIFEQVRAYLANGDITGSIRHSFYRLAALEKLLIVLQGDICMKRLPDLALSWKLNEMCAENTLFGSYAARILNSL